MMKKPNKLILKLLLIAICVGQVSAANYAAPAACLSSTCANEIAKLRQLEKTVPSRKLTRQQIFNRIKASCDRMRRLDCPGIREFKPNICFTDF
jgi:hypothetical protein